MPSPERQSGFGNSLSLDGETLLIGEPRVSGADINGTGVTHVYSRGAGGWQKDVEWMLPETVDSSSSEFGAGLAIDGNTAVVGAPRADHIIEQTVNPDGSVLTLAGDGLAFVYERTAGVWGEPLEFNPGERQAFGFGRSVAIRANLLAIGRTTSSSVGGEVYLYERDGDGWSEIAILEAVVQVSGD